MNMTWKQGKVTDWEIKRLREQSFEKKERIVEVNGEEKEISL